MFLPLSLFCQFGPANLLNPDVGREYRDKILARGGATIVDGSVAFLIGLKHISTVILFHVFLMRDRELGCARHVARLFGARSVQRSVFAQQGVDCVIEADLT